MKHRKLKTAVSVIVFICVVSIIIFAFYSFQKYDFGAQTVSDERLTVNGDKVWFEYDGYGYACLPEGYAVSAPPSCIVLTRLKHGSYIASITDEVSIFKFSENPPHDYLYCDYTDSDFYGGDCYREDLVLPTLSSDYIESVDFCISAEESPIFQVCETKYIQQVLDVCSESGELSDLPYLADIYSLHGDISVKVIFKNSDLIYVLN